ncbi:MAG: hypothetical protein LQ337_002488 [Flavoplaca oasis]|nr:MAG: hypothetical protein LQ337_002488 [Flavoplaca oasis]
MITSEYSTVTWSGPREVISIVTNVTRYRDTTVTNLQTTTTLVNTTLVTSYDYALNPIPAVTLDHQTLVAENLQGNGTETITAGVTVQSPNAFYVFSTVKVIWVPPVVDRSNGRVVCGTASTDQGCCTAYDEAVRCFTRGFSKINENGEAYFDGRPATAFYEPRLQRRARCSPDQIIGQSGFKYQDRPEDAPIDAGPGFNDAENHGHVPQALLDWMLKDPLYVAQLPDLASCGPGGPVIKTPRLCANTPAPAYVEVVSALTVGTENVVDGAGCFRPGACPTISTPNNQAGTPAIASAQVTADPLQVGDSGTKTSGQTSPISQNGVAPNAPATLPSQAVSEPAGGTSEPPRESSVDDPAIYVDQTVIPEDAPQQQTPAADSQGVDVGSITSTTNLDDQNVIGSQTPAADSFPTGIDDPTFSNPIVTTPPISNDLPSLPGQATLLSKDIPSSPTSPPLDQDWIVPPVDQVSSNSQASFGGMSGSPVETLSDEQTPALLNDWATAEVQSQSGDASLGSETPLLNDEPATPGDRANENWQADIASLIMKAFGSAPGSAPGSTPGSAPGSAAFDGASPEAEAGAQSSTTERLPSNVLGTLDSAIPTEPTSPDNDAIINSLSLQSSFLTKAESIGSPVVIVGNTIQPGSSVTISGTIYALPSSSTGILVNGSPSPLSPPFDPAKSRPPASDDVVLASVTAASYSIIPGAPGITISGTTYSRPATGTEIFINGSPSLIPSNILEVSISQSSLPQIQQPRPPKGFPSPSNLPDTARSQSALIIASQTLQPGQAITVSGNIISLPPTGIDHVVVDGQTQSISLLAAAGSRSPSSIIFTDADRSFTARLVEATLTAFAKNATGMSISNDVESGSGTPTTSGVEDVETQSPESGGSANGTTGEGSGTESLSVRNARRASWVNAWAAVLSILMAMLLLR